MANMSDPSNESIAGTVLEQAEKSEPKTPSIICYQCGGEMTPIDDIETDNNGNNFPMWYYECVHCGRDDQ